MRFNPLVRRLHALVQDGGLGEPRSLLGVVRLRGGAATRPVGCGTPRSAAARCSTSASTPSTWRACCSATRCDGDAPAGRLAPTGVDAESTVLLTTAGGAQAVLDQSLLTRLPGTALLVGSARLGRAVALLPRADPARGAARRVRAGGARDRRPAAGFVGELEEVERCLAEGRTESDVMPLSASTGTAAVLAEARRQVGA